MAISFRSFFLLFLRFTKRVLCIKNMVPQLFLNWGGMLSFQSIQFYFYSPYSQITISFIGHNYLYKMQHPLFLTLDQHEKKTIQNWGEMQKPQGETQVKDPSLRKDRIQINQQNNNIYDTYEKTQKRYNNV